MSKLFKALEQLFCSHRNTLKKRKPVENSDLYVLYVECMDCGMETEGIETGGFKSNFNTLAVA